MSQRGGGSAKALRAHQGIIDREEERNQMRQFLRRDPEAMQKVVHFSGVGGTGKSRLLEEIRAMCEADGLPTALLDFDGREDLLDVPDNLAEVAEQLKLECPRFTLAYHLSRHQGQLAPDPTRSGAVGSLGVVPEMLIQLIGIAHPGIAASIDLAKECLGRTKKPAEAGKALRRYLHRLFGNDLEWAEAIAHGPSVKSGQRLCQYLVEDICSAMRSKKAGPSRLALLVDTTERQRRDGLRPDLNYEERERWIVDLCTGLDGLDGRPLALVVTAGRERLMWSKYEKRINLVQWPLGGLGLNDADTLLRERGVQEPQIRQAILPWANDRRLRRDGGDVGIAQDRDLGDKYHPMMLCLCADTHSHLGPGSTTEYWQGAPVDLDWERAAGRFLDSIESEAMHNAVRSLALCRDFDKLAAHDLIGHHGMRQFECDFWRYSFVEDLGSDLFGIHSVVAEAIVRTLTVEERLDADQYWRQYWKSRSEGPSDAFALRSWLHEYGLQPAAALRSWQQLAADLSSAERPDEYRSVLRWWSSVDLRSLEGLQDAEVLGAIGERLLLGAIEVDIERAPLAADFLSRSVRIRATPRSRLELAVAQLLAVSNDKAMSPPPMTEKTLKSVLAREKASPLLRANACRNLALLKETQGKPKEAASGYQRTVELLQQVPNSFKEQAGTILDLLRARLDEDIPIDAVQLLRAYRDAAVLGGGLKWNRWKLLQLRWVQDRQDFVEEPVDFLPLESACAMIEVCRPGLNVPERALRQLLRLVGDSLEELSKRERARHRVRNQIQFWRACAMLRHPTPARKHLGKTIDLLQEVVSACQKDYEPRQWARAANNLGVAYVRLSWHVRVREGMRAKHREAGIEWLKRAMSALGITGSRLHKTVSRNLELAVGEAENWADLEILSPEPQPVLWDVRSVVREASPSQTAEEE